MKLRIILSLLFMPNLLLAETSLNVVTTLSTFASIAKDIGGEYVSVTYIASPRFNPHFIEPKPSDILRLKRADLFIHAGLDLEAWRGPLVDATANPDIRPGGSKELDLSKGIQLLNVPTEQLSRAHGDIHLFGNPHYWLMPGNGQIIAKSIYIKLSTIDPSHASFYQSNYEKFKSTLLEKINYWSSLAGKFSGAKLVGYHDEWVYLIKFLNMQMDEFLEPKPGIPPTPKHLESIKDYIINNKVRAIIQASFYSSEAARSLSVNTNARVLLLCQNVNEKSECSNYNSMLEYNITSILGTFGE